MTKTIVGIGAAGRAVGRGAAASGRAVGRRMVESGEWVWEHPKETVLIGVGVGIIVFDVATVPSGEGSFGVIIIRKAVEAR